MMSKNNLSAWIFCVTLIALLTGVSSSGMFHRTKRSTLDNLRFGSKPPDANCTDFCQVHPTQCKHGGTCIMDEITCVASCACVEGYSGRWCEAVVPVEDNQEEWSGIKESNTGTEMDGHGNNPMPDLSHLTRGTSRGFFTWGGSEEHSAVDDERSCYPGFTCVHGYCDKEALKNNTLKCICEDNYVDTFCDKPCPLECGKHGHCGYVKNDTYQCVCEWKFTGKKCDEVVPDPVPLEEPALLHWYVLGPSIGAVVLVLIVLVVVPYWMWRKRLVVVLKIIHYFQKYEDDDGKDYDAFVSYKSTPRDEQFVLQQLMPRLEGEMKYKLCLHFRDFLPGEAIANNIVKAIENSRRTIMILSPAYVESEWCRMEYQKAQHEMLKLKHKIIPIVLEDFAHVKTVDKNLKCILNSVTYIDWPGQESSKRMDRFWRKLEFSLPKKSLKSSSSPHVSSSGSPQEKSDQSSHSNLEPVATSNPKTPSIPISPNTATSPKPNRKRRDLKHFMQSMLKKKFYSRQDSSSSQLGLVDDESSGIGSLDSCSDTLATDNTGSTCSTPESTHTKSSGAISQEQCSCGSGMHGTECSSVHEPVSFIDEHKSGSYIGMNHSGHYIDNDSSTMYMSMNGKHEHSGNYVDMDTSGSYLDMSGSNMYVDMSKTGIYVDMNQSSEKSGACTNHSGCYLDMNSSDVYVNMSNHGGGNTTTSSTYVAMDTSPVRYANLRMVHCQADTNSDANSEEKSSYCSEICAKRSLFTGKDTSVFCIECKRIRDKSDNNMVRISLVTGNDEVRKIEKVHMEAEKCQKCIGKSEFTRTRSLRKNQKDELNRQLVRQNWVGSLGRYSGSELKNEVVLNTDMLHAYCNQSFVGDNGQTKFYIDVCENV